MEAFPASDNAAAGIGALIPGSQFRTVAVVPEPASVTLLVVGLCFGLAGWWRKRRRAA